MLWFEREVVGALIDPRSSDPEARSRSRRSSTARCATCPSTCALGVVGESVLLGTYAGALRADRPAPGRRCRRPWPSCSTGGRRARIGVLRQYVRMMKSLVLFAENELAPEAAA